MSFEEEKDIEGIKSSIGILPGIFDENCGCSYDKEYLKKLRKKAAWIKDVDADEYLNEIRGRK